MTADLTGERFGRLIVVERLTCDACGESSRSVREVTRDELRNGVAGTSDRLTEPRPHRGQQEAPHLPWGASSFMGS